MVVNDLNCSGLTASDIDVHPLQGFASLDRVVPKP